MNLENINNIQIPQGYVKQIKNSQGNILWSAVPKEYQLLQYIQSSGTQYIDTGVTLNYARKKLQQTATAQYTTNNSNRELMGANGYGFWGKAANNKIESAVGNAVGITESALSKNTVTLITNPFDDNAIIFEVNSNRYQSRASTLADNDYACYLFALGGRDGAAASFFCNVKIYEYMILLDDVIVSHLIPVKRYSDDTLGMYDIITRNFLVNAGTGTFIAGYFS